MSSLLTTAPVFGNYHSLRRFTVDEYHRMIDTGILNETDRVELLEGYVVLKMPRNPLHDGTIDLGHKALARRLPVAWWLRIQQGITLDNSEPEPDLAVVRGDERTYLRRHPGPADVGLLLEVAESSLVRDRDDKGRIYAHAGIPIYWIVNLIDKRIEVYTLPSGATTTTNYAQRQDFSASDTIPLLLDQVVVAAIPVAELLP